MNEQRYRVARRMSRREALSLIGAFPLLPFDAVRGADVNPPLSCVATPTQTEGPYFVDERLNRADIRSDPMSGIVKEGVPLKLRLFAHAIAAGACPCADTIRLESDIVKDRSRTSFFIRVSYGRLNNPT